MFEQIIIETDDAVMNAARKTNDENHYENENENENENEKE